MSLTQSAYGALSSVMSNIFIPLPIPKADLSGQTYIVSGSNTGLGFEASRHINRLGASKLIMAVRSPSKGETARREILKSTGREDSSIEVWELDMNSYESVKKFAARVTSSLPRVDGVLANAGIMVDVFQMSEDNESTMTVNVVSTFLLLLVLLPKLRESATKFDIAPRFTIVNSALHYTAPLKELDPARVPGRIFDTLNGKDAEMNGRYSVSKLLVLYAVRELAARIKASPGSGEVVINTPNPSWCRSALSSGTERGRSGSAQMAEKLIARSTEVGSRALVHGVVSGPETNGQYLNNCHVSVYVSHPSLFSLRPRGLLTQFTGRRRW
jgi:NAD(P)-dependent dehydrogenase (short-subunit alcohol dehydrogenase family)